MNEYYRQGVMQASLIIKRIHKANSVQLGKRNKDKMQKFYDVDRLFFI